MNQICQLMRMCQAWYQMSMMCMLPCQSMLILTQPVWTEEGYLLMQRRQHLLLQQIQRHVLVDFTICTFIHRHRTRLMIYWYLVFSFFVIIDVAEYGLGWVNFESVHVTVFSKNLYVGWPQELALPYACESGLSTIFAFADFSQLLTYMYVTCKCSTRPFHSSWGLVP